MQSYAFFRLRAIAYLRYFSSEKIVSRGRSRLKQPHCLSNIPTHDTTTPPLPCESGFPGSSEGRSCSLRGPLRACVKAFLASSPRIFRLLYKSVSASIREALKTSPQKPLCRHSEKGRADGGGGRNVNLSDPPPRHRASGVAAATSSPMAARRRARAPRRAKGAPSMKVAQIRERQSNLFLIYIAQFMFFTYLCKTKDKHLT